MGFRWCSTRSSGESSAAAEHNLSLKSPCPLWARQFSVFPPPKAMINCVLQIFCIFLIYPLVKRPIF